MTSSKSKTIVVNELGAAHRSIFIADTPLEKIAIELEVTKVKIDYNEQTRVKSRRSSTFVLCDRSSGEEAVKNDAIHFFSVF